MLSNVSFCHAFKKSSNTVLNGALLLFTLSMSSPVQVRFLPDDFLLMALMGVIEPIRGQFIYARVVLKVYFVTVKVGVTHCALNRLFIKSL